MTIQQALIVMIEQNIQIYRMDTLYFTSDYRINKMDAF